MSYLSKIFQSIPVKIPDRSGFDLSHEVISTANCGTVVPISHWEVNPGDTFSFGASMKVTLPPFAVPFMGRIDAELTAAFIPYRLVWKAWQAFITQNDGSNGTSREGSFVGGSSPYIPTHVPLVDTSAMIQPKGSLSDYLGMRKPSLCSALPFLCYHKFCDDWIRDDQTMKPFFSQTPYNVGVGTTGAGNAIFSNAEIPHVLNSIGAFYVSQSSGTSVSVPKVDLTLPLTPLSSAYADQPYDTTLGLGALRQRCWAKDYFTTATYRPQAGAASSVVFDTSGATGSITIASLRAANSLQKWMERNNISGTDYGDQILAHFGVRPPDAVLNRSLLLGSVRTPVYVGSVTNNSTASPSSRDGTSSPYGAILGSAAGFGSGSDKGSLCDNFTAKEHGIIMVFFTLIPHAYYDAAVIRSNMHQTIGDFAFPEFAGIGDQPIYDKELSADVADSDTNIFGYNQRYSEYKFLPDRISGIVASGGSLSAYALKRKFPVTSGALDVDLGSSFMEIPTDYLSQVFAFWDPETGTGQDTGPVDAGFSCMIDAYFDVKALRILPEYSLPHL